MSCADVCVNFNCLPILCVKRRPNSDPSTTSQRHATRAGWFQIPAAIDQPLELALNPAGDEWRSERRVWNAGDGRTKLVCLAAPPSPDPVDLPGDAASTGVPQQALSRA